MKVEIDGKTYPITNQTEWAKAVDAYKYGPGKGSTKGFWKYTTGEDKPVSYTDSKGEVWKYSAGARGGAGSAKSQTAVDTQERNRLKSEQTQSTVDGKTWDFDEVKRQRAAAGVFTPSVQDLHHMRGLQQMKPFFAGLNEKESLELVKWFYDEGFPIGNHPGNLIEMYQNQKKGGTTIADTHQGEGSIHRHMRDMKMEPMSSQKEYKVMEDMFKGKTLNERLPMIINYLSGEQKHIQSLLGRPTDYDELDARQQSVGVIESGPRAGERMPTNRATLGLDPKGPAIRGAGERLLDTIKGTTKAGRAVRLGAAATLPGALTLPASAAAYQQAEQDVQQDPSLRNRAVQVATGAQVLGDSLDTTGSVLTATGVGAPVGVPMMAVGGGISNVGAVAENIITAPEAYQRSTEQVAERTGKTEEEVQSDPLGYVSLVNKVRQTAGELTLKGYNALQSAFR